MWASVAGLSTSLRPRRRMAGEKSRGANGYTTARMARNQDPITRAIASSIFPESYQAVPAYVEELLAD
jgi:hypothetical protein